MKLSEGSFQQSSLSSNILVWINFVDYFGAILSYFIMAVPIFGLNWYEDKSGVELTGIVSKVSVLVIRLN